MHSSFSFVIVYVRACRDAQLDSGFRSDFWDPLEELITCITSPIPLRISYKWAM